MVEVARLQALHDVSLQIEALLERVRAGNVERYRQQALYLQVLRGALLDSVQRACFTLATRHGGQAYASLAEPQRLALHRHLEALVLRCCSLLTVEQLAVLGAQLQRRRRQAPRSPGPGEEHAGDLPSSSRGGAETMAETRADIGTDTGAEAASASVHLQLDPPLSPDLFSAALQGLRPMASPPEPLRGLSAASAERLSLPERDLPPADFGDSSAAQPAGMLLPLPEHPLQQLQWWERFDRALQRRLRNLSHAINVELLRVGVASALLPVQLLDAVLEGQLEPEPAPANLVRLPLPFPGAEAERSPAFLGLLLRCSDLEYEWPRLRTCRQRLRLQRQELRRMAQQFRRLERRAQVLEAEQLWMEDTGHASITGRPPV